MGENLGIFGEELLLKDTVSNSCPIDYIIFVQKMCVFMKFYYHGYSHIQLKNQLAASTTFFENMRSFFCLYDRSEAMAERGMSAVENTPVCKESPQSFVISEGLIITLPQQAYLFHQTVYVPPQTKISVASHND